MKPLLAIILVCTCVFGVAVTAAQTIAEERSDLTPVEKGVKQKLEAAETH